MSNLQSFSLNINMGNAAMESRYDVAQALRKIAKKLDAGADYGTIMDENGNKVGTFSF